MRVPVQLGMAVLLAAFFGASAFAQSQPLGDVARQQQLQKEPSPAPERVITNEDIPAVEVSVKSDAKPGESAKTEKSAAKKADELPDADAVRTKISAQKQKVKELEAKIATDQAELDKHDSIHGNVQVYETVYLRGTGLGSPGPGFCSFAYALNSRPDLQEWCAEPDKLQDEIDSLQKQLDSERATLGAMQEEARQQGFGNSVYDPD